MRTLIIFAIVFSTCGCGAVEVPPREKILDTLRKEHPRLFATQADFKRLKSSVSSGWPHKLKAQADDLIGQPSSKYEIPDGLRLLGVSRRVLHRVQTLGLMYRIHGQRKYADRAWKELAAAANFPDWNPRHFLDTAEMTHAFAIGYDWLYDAWTPEQRAQLRTAMIEKGLRPALNVYRGNPRPSSSWNKVRHNWNQVCNGGIGIGALAIADKEPDLAGELLEAAAKSIQLAMREFAPDGAWAEGPGYWNYATTYNVAFLAALETALGTDFGLGNIPGFAEAGMFPVHLTGPLNRTFNYADGSDGAIRAPHLFWMARRYDQPPYARYQFKMSSAHPMDLLWRREAPSESSDLPLNKYFRGAEVVTFRSAWNDPNAVFVGFKAGDNKANHSNLDLGTFVLDALGVRWGVDLGADNYNLPGYFGKSRWTYYRMRAEGHNTLVINPGTEPDQDPAAAAKITTFRERGVAIADLTPAYKQHARKVQRGIACQIGATNGKTSYDESLIAPVKQHILVQDEIETKAPADLWWFLHTPAEIQITENGTEAVLTRDKARLVARILSPANARFTRMAAEPLPTSPRPEKQNNNSGVQKLAIHFENIENLTIAVSFSPVSENRAPLNSSLKVTPLSQW
jgi:hypothetical protein